MAREAVAATATADADARAVAEPEEVTEESVPATGALSVLVRDREGRPLAGIPVLVDGRDDVQLTSDQDGFVRADLPPGPYSIGVVKGCAGAFEVTDGEVATARLVAGQPLNGTLWVEWRHRYAPDTLDHVSDWSRADGASESYTLPTWTPGAQYVVSFAVVDRCGRALAGGASIAEWEISGSANVVVDDDGGRRSDSGGMARMTAHCTGPGLISLRLTNSRDRDDWVELLSATARGGGRPTCGRS